MKVILLLLCVSSSLAYQFSRGRLPRHGHFGHKGPQSTSSQLRDRSDRVSSESVPTVDSISSHFNKFPLQVAKCLMVWLAVSPINQNALAASYVPECSESIVVVKDASHDKNVVLVGTAHISEDSANQVRRVIKGSHPDVVMIELDAKRIGRVGKGQSLADLGFLTPPVEQQAKATALLAGQSQKLSLLDKVVSAVTAPLAALAGAALGQLLGQFYNSVEKLGFTAGGEFQAAVQEARGVDAKVLLGDRDVDVTLQRLAAALRGADQDKFSRLMQELDTAQRDLGLDLDSSQQIDKQALSSFVEGIKTTAAVQQLMSLVQKELPDVYSALIGERDEYMAESIANAQGHNMVAVVGFAHLPGITSHLVQDLGFEAVANSNCPK